MSQREGERKRDKYKYIHPCVCVLSLCWLIDCEGSFKEKPGNPDSCGVCCVSLQSEICKRESESW